VDGDLVDGYSIADGADGASPAYVFAMLPGPNYMNGQVPLLSS